MWIELGFRALSGVGWPWKQTRRTDPDRVARHWLVLAVASLWVLACGTRVETAQALHRLPCHVQRPVPLPPGFRRTSSLFRLGVFWLQRLLHQGRLWQHWWLRPQPEPPVPPSLTVTYEQPP